MATLNLLIEACKLYVNCELFITERHLLAINCIEKSIQEELLKNFSKFHCDFLNHDMGTRSTILSITKTIRKITQSIYGHQHRRKSKKNKLKIKLKKQKILQHAQRSYFKYAKRGCPCTTPNE